MEYKIKISYQTGGSFGRHDKEDFLDIAFQNLDIAKENLVRIKEHNEMYLAIEGSSWDKTQEILELNKYKKWFVNKPKLYSIKDKTVIDEKQRGRYKDSELKYIISGDSAQISLILKTDNGNNYQLCAFWCGYFETLYSAEIVIEGSDLKIEF